VKLVLAIVVVSLVLVLILLRVESESGPMALAGCKAAVAQAKSWTLESTSQPDSSTNTIYKNRVEVSCPDSYKSVFKSRTPDNVIQEQATVYTSGVTYVENLDGNWTKGPTAGESPALKECGKGPLLVQQTVLNAMLELPHRKAGSIVKGQLQIVDGAKCQEWHVEYGNEWPQTAPFTVCIDRKTHLPRRIIFSESGGTDEFTGWNSTTVEPPTL